MIRLYGEELAPRPTSKLEDHPLSAVRDYLFNTFAVSFYIGGRSSIRNLRTRHAMVTETHLSWSIIYIIYKWHSKLFKNEFLKADSHIACRAHAAPLPCRALIHTCHAAPLPCSDIAVSFVKVRMIAGNIRTASQTV